MLRKILGLFLITLMLGLTSCEDYFGNVNENPNRPTDVSVDVILSAAIVEVADLYGGDFSRPAAILTQHAEGVARQWSSMNNYSGYVPANFNTAWVNTYANVFNELAILKAKATEAGFNHYAAIADILTAFHLMNATDVWNEIPYTQALQGTDNTAAAFDSQESLYNEVFSLLANAGTLLAGAAGDVAPGADDIIYGGDAALWTKAAKAIEARGRLHLALVDNANYAAAAAAAAASFADAGESMTLQYGTGETEAAQWYRFNRDRTGDIEFHPTYYNMMTANNDTMRRNLLDATFNPDHPYLVPNFNQPLVTYREMKFLEAEVLMVNNGSDADIHAAFRAGLEAAFAHFGVGSADDVDPGVGNVTMEHIMVQKSIALFGTLEPYNDWRRTGLPALTPNDGVAVPTRWPYGDSEIIFNPSTPSVTVTDPVWWDR